MTKYEVTIDIGYSEKTFTFDDYDSVQNLIGYMVEGSDSVRLSIRKVKTEREAVDENDN